MESLLSPLLRLLVTPLFLVSAVSKLLGVGANPSPSLKIRIRNKTASWFDLEYTAAAHTWDKEFNMPPSLMRSFGVFAMICVLALNAFPPPHKYGVYAAMGLLTIMGGGFHTYMYPYRSLRHAVPALISSASIILLLRDSFQSGPEFFLHIALPLYIGFVSASAILVYRLNGGKFALKFPKKRKY
jgi:hypothetical protein